MPLSDTIRQAVHRNGQLSAKLGRPVTVCPFPQGTDHERALARIWVSGYMSAAPPPPGVVDLDTEVVAETEPATDATEAEQQAQQDMAQAEEDHSAALLALLAAWPLLAAPVTAALAGAAAQTAAAGGVATLGTLPVSAEATAAITAAIRDALMDLARTSAGRARAEAARQGVTIDTPEVDTARLSTLAGATSELLVGGYRSAAARAAINTTGPGTNQDDVAAAVHTATDDLTRTAASQQRGEARGFVAGELAAALQAAIHTGRAAVFQALVALGVPVVFVADERNDRSTCPPCREINTTEFDDLREALAAYPAGTYIGCLGRNRCRGQLRARITRDDVAAAAPGSDPMVEDLLWALAFVAGELVEAAWNSDSHPRWPKGTPGGKGGKFREKLAAHIEKWMEGDRSSHPLEGFTRTQLERAARRRGLKPSKSATRDEISRDLLKSVLPKKDRDKVLEREKDQSRSKDESSGRDSTSEDQPRDRPGAGEDTTGRDSTDDTPVDTDRAGEPADTEPAGDNDTGVDRDGEDEDAEPDTGDAETTREEMDGGPVTVDRSDEEDQPADPAPTPVDDATVDRSDDEEDQPADDTVTDDTADQTSDESAPPAGDDDTADQTSETDPTSGDSERDETTVPGEETQLDTAEPPAGNDETPVSDNDLGDSTSDSDDTGADPDEPVRPDGDGPLEEVPADGVRPDDQPGDVLREPGERDREPDSRPDRSPGGDDPAEPAVPGPVGTDDGGEADSGAGDSGGDAATGGGRRDWRVDATDVFRPRSQADLAPSTATKRLEANLEALRTLRRLRDNDQAATPEDQAKLARWSGWGSLPNVFKEPPPEGRYAAAQAELKELLTPEEFAAARRTTRNAHYTDAGYVSAIWDAVERLGFDGGEVLEPGSGSGTFMGMVPERIAADTHVTGVELDPITAAIAHALYPNQDVRAESFATTRTRDGAFDAAVGNVPFSDTKLVDPEYNPGRRNNMHNHFILKSLRMTRPGGIGAFITSRYTMDSMSPAAREEMAQLADLVGAVRLPSRAHEKAAGTSVVTDLLVFRRREPDTPYAGIPFQNSRKTDIDGQEVSVNELFLDNPDMVLGTMQMGSGLKDAFGVKGAADAEPGLRKALDKIVTRAEGMGLTHTPGQQPRPTFIDTVDAVPDGYLRAHEDGSFTRVSRGLEQPYPVASTQREELRELLRLRDLSMALVEAEAASGDDTAEMKRLREDLNITYDKYVAKWGPVSRYTETRRAPKSGEDDDDVEEERVTRRRPPQGGFRSDPFSAAVRALENYDPVTGKATKNDIFHRRTIEPRTPRTSADNPSDALAITLDQFGEVDLPHIAGLLDVDEATARERLGTLVFDDPGNGRVMPRAEYLSGNVRQKLDAARLAAAEDPRFEANVEELERVLPADLTPEDINVKMGAGWVEPRHVQQFLRTILRDPTLTVENPHGTQWSVEGRKKSTAATTEWGIREFNAVDLAKALLEQKPITVRVEGKVDQDRTERAQEKAREMSDRFAQWIWENPERSREVQDAYNRRFNSLVLRSYDGTAMELPGLSRDGFYPYPHRYAAIRRIIAEPSVGLWHEVGAGKTTVMIASAMEMRRLGLVKKPAMVVPNHMLDQMASEFLERYPQARVLTIGSDDLKNDKDGEKRRDIIAKAATGDWDAVILTQGAFKRIPVSADTERDYLQSQVEPLRRSAERRRAAVVRKVHDDNPDATQEKLAELVKEALAKDSSVKDLEGQVEKAEERIKEQLGSAPRDPGLSFENTGIDYLFVDEAHTYKNLRTSSSNPSLSIPGSKIATDLHMKLHHLRSRYDRVATLATATPVANSVSESYTMLRYLRPDLLEEMGVETFDEFAANFGEVTTRLEVSPTGGLRQHSRFAKFVNLPELLRPWLVASDVKTAEDLKDIVKVPNLVERVDADGNRTRAPETVVVPPSPELQEFMQQLVTRARMIPYPPQKGDDNMLKITGEGRAAALDLKMVGRDTDEPSKLDIAAGKITAIYETNKDKVYTDRDGNPVGEPGALQLVFSDIGTPSSSRRKKTGRKIKKSDLRPGLRVTSPDGRRAGTVVDTEVRDEDDKAIAGAFTVRWDGADSPREESFGGSGLYLAEPTDGSDQEEAHSGLAGFDAYAALRDKLVERGIPRDKIRFIHEANTDQEKAELFAAARDGRIAVLVGSTGKMGVGTNVQDRAIALHHLDVPWRPADVQQREGRHVRQGNKNPEVQTIRYVTEQSFDAYIWQAVATKSTFINQIMRGRLDVREVDDVGDFTLSATEVTALGTGNRWLIEHADASAELTRLERARRNHDLDQRNIAKRIADAEADIAQSEKIIAQIDKAIPQRVDKAKRFRMKLDGDEYRDRGEAQTRIRKLINSARSTEPRAIGEFRGFPLQASQTDREFVVELAGVPGQVKIRRGDLGSTDVIGDLQNVLGRMERTRSRHVARIGESRQDSEALRARQGRPFRDQDALEQARERFQRVDQNLKAELEKRGQKPEPTDPAEKAAARKAAELDAIKTRLNAGEGFQGLGELTTWLEADEKLAEQIPSDAGKKWGVLSPQGQLLVMKSEAKGYDIVAPRTMLGAPVLFGFRTQKQAKEFAEELEKAGVPWNADVDLREWRGPDGITLGEIVAELRGRSRDLDPNGTWKQRAAQAKTKRLVPDRLHEALLIGDYRGDGLGVNMLVKVAPQSRDEVIEILQSAGKDPDSDMALVARLREYGVGDIGDVDSRSFALSAARRLERDYRQRVPQPLDRVRRRFEADLARLQYRGRSLGLIEQILAEADTSGDFGAAAAKLRAYAEEQGETDRQRGLSPYSWGPSPSSVAADLANVLERMAAQAE